MQVFEVGGELISIKGASLLRLICNKALFISVVDSNSSGVFLLM